MIIICPNCNAQYEVASQAIGSAGRKVKCASCSENWQAFPEPEQPAKSSGPKLVPDPEKASAPTEGAAAEAQAVNAEPDPEDKLFGAEEEEALDAQFEREEERYEAQNPKQEDARTQGGAGQSDADKAGDHQRLDESEMDRRREALRKRHAVLARNLPRSKLKRVVRMTALVGLMTTLIGGVMFKDSIVKTFPELAGIYTLFGQRVNIVGLEFENVETVRTLRDGAETLLINAELVNVKSSQVTLPRVHVILSDVNGDKLYEWNANPQARALGGGERLMFSTQLVSPPAGVTSLSLGFVDSIGTENLNP